MLQRRTRRRLALPLAGLLGALVLVVGTTHPVAAAPTAPVIRMAPLVPAASVPAAARRAPDSYTPKPGVLFNQPLRKSGQRTINDHVLRSINSVPRGGKIRIMSWNIKSLPYRRALIRANNRGVSVRLIMSNGLAKKQPRSTGDYWVLKRAFRDHQEGRPGDMTSWMRACVASCRGTRGIAHAKFYTFDQVGNATDVVMTGSANMTEVASTNQWNDMFTVVGDEPLYDWYQHVFGEDALDHRANPPYQTFKASPTMTAWAFPFLGRDATVDPVVRILRQTQCTGAAPGVGINGRTVVRVGQTALLDDRGLQIARLLKNLYNEGCNVRVAYTVLGPQVAKLFRSTAGRGRMPARQIAQDFDGDGKFDRYLHLKDLVIDGHFQDRRDAHFVYNGTQNWTETSALSDEMGFSLDDPAIAAKYVDRIDSLYLNPPYNPHPNASDGGVEARTVGGRTVLTGAYSKVQLN